MPTLQYKRFIYVTFFLSLIFADVGGTISLQGVLRDPNGTTVTDGSYSLTMMVPTFILKMILQLKNV